MADSDVHPNDLLSLSERAQAVATRAGENLIWDILDNQWDPKNNPDGYISLGVAENRLMHSELEEYINKNLGVSQFGFTYGDGTRGSKVLRAAVARFINRHFHPAKPIDLSSVAITNGVSSAIEHCSWAFADRGDAFLLGQPYYGAFLPDINRRPEVEVLTVKFGEVDPLSIEAVKQYEAEILKARNRGVRVKGLMLCSPHNPLSRCYPREVLVEYMKLCQKCRIHLISDEIYALSIWTNTEDSDPPPTDFVSVLSIPNEGLIDSHLLHVLHGMSKDFCANGLRMGWIISPGNSAFSNTLKSTTIQSSSSSICDSVVARLLNDDVWVDSYIKTNQQRLSEAYSFVVKFLRQHNISYKPGANAAFFLWVDLGKAYLDRHPERKLDTKGVPLKLSEKNVAGKSDAQEDVMKSLEKHLAEAKLDENTALTSTIMESLLKHKLFLASGTAFGAETPGLFRIVFSHPKDYVEEALTRMIRAIEE